MIYDVSYQLEMTAFTVILVKYDNTVTPGHDTHLISFNSNGFRFYSNDDIGIAITWVAIGR